MLILITFQENVNLFLSNLCQPIKSNIIKVHLARSARRRYITPGALADRDSVDVGQNDALIGKGL